MTGLFRRIRLWHLQIRNEANEPNVNARMWLCAANGKLGRVRR